MEHDFWHNRWQNQQIGFHLPEANPLLVAHLSALNLAPPTPQKSKASATKNPRLLLPLCGKTLDIAWLLAQGYQVAGVELSKIAIDALFSELKIQPAIYQKNGLLHYRAPNIDLYVGDILELTPNLLGKVDAIYDRAALVALPEDLRMRYTAHLITLTHVAPQLLVCFEYDQSQHAGPPFSVNADEITRHYSGAYQIDLLANVPMIDGLKGLYPATEHVWKLMPLEKNNRLIYSDTTLYF